ncbi:MAG: hypothetical protein JNL97_01965, partial [Verrucomicrobiales bacterium]|nr:hypothetical protein [Verrucomicrobiales bacterium]
MPPSLDALPEPRRLDVPSLDALLRKYRATESFCRWILGFEIATVVVLIALALARGPATIPWPAWVAAAVGG